MRLENKKRGQNRAEMEKKGRRELQAFKGQRNSSKFAVS
jgi:hypothetical protein